MPSSPATLQEKLGYSFKDENLLTEALTHASHGQEQGAIDNERLEFLGDRVLGLLVAERLINAFPEDAEGALAMRLNALVRKEACAAIADALELDRFMWLGPSEQAKRGKVNKNLQANAVEALLGALYIDGGLEATRPVFETYWLPLFDSVPSEPRDAKSSLQEWAQGQGLGLPSYEIVTRTGPDHSPHFVVRASVEGKGEADGQGASKRKAEQAAAKALLEEHGVWSKNA